MNDINDQITGSLEGIKSLIGKVYFTVNTHLNTVEQFIIKDIYFFRLLVSKDGLDLGYGMDVLHGDGSRLGPSELQLRSSDIRDECPCFFKKEDAEKFLMQASDGT